MSKIKKAINKIANNIEFFNSPSMILEMLDTWGSKQPRAVMYEYQFAVAGTRIDTERLRILLKDNKTLVNTVLKIKSCDIEQWYFNNLDELQLNQQRLQLNKIATLTKICGDYKQYLHDVIETKFKKIKASPPPINFKTLHDSFKPSANQADYGQQAERKSIPDTFLQGEAKTPINKNYTLDIALNKFRTVHTLHFILQGQDHPQRKIEKFEQVFHAPRNQAVLNTHRDSTGLRFLKNIGHVLTFGIVSKIKHNTFKFWKARSQVLANTIQEKVDEIKNLAPAP